MQKEDAALAAQAEGEAEETDGLLADLEKSLEVDPNSEPEARTPMLLGMGKSRKSDPWRPQIFPSDPTKLLKTQVRCPESDRTIPILGLMD